MKIIAKQLVLAFETMHLKQLEDERFIRDILQSRGMPLCMQRVMRLYHDWDGSKYKCEG